MAPIEKENPVMRIASVIARYLAGVIFLVMGLNGFLNFIPFPPSPGIAGEFMVALYVSHYLWVIFAFPVIAGVLLLANRFVPLAVAVLAPVIVNILTFHATVAPSGLPLALFVAVLWALIFVDVRPAFTGLFQSRLQPEEVKQSASRACDALVHAVTVRIADYIVSTARNRALPSATRS